MKTKEDEIHAIIAEAKAEGDDSRRQSRSTQPLGDTNSKKVGPKQTGVEKGDKVEKVKKGRKVSQPLRCLCERFVDSGTDQNQRG